MTVSRLYIAGMLAFGLVAGLVLAAAPAARDVMPVLIWPLLVSFLVDLVLMRRAQAGQTVPITMTQRAVAVVGSSLVILLVIELMKT